MWVTLINSNETDLALYLFNFWQCLLTTRIMSMLWMDLHIKKVCRRIKKRGHLVSPAATLQTKEKDFACSLVFLSVAGISQLPLHLNGGFLWTIYSFTFFFFQKSTLVHTHAWHMSSSSLSVHLIVWRHSPSYHQTLWLQFRSHYISLKSCVMSAPK